MLTIGFIGNFNEPFSTENDLKWELEQLGHRVIPVQEQNANADMVMRELQGSDVIFYSHTHGRPIVDIFEAAKSANIPTVAYHLDLFHGVEKEREVGESDYWKVKYFFSVDPNIIPKCNADAALPTAFYLPAGVVSRDAVLAEPRPDMRQDVIFVGSRGYHPEWPYRPQLIDWLKATYGDRFTHWGNDGLRYIRMGDLNQLYASAKVVVGDSLCHNFTYEGYWSDRPYETTGRGGFIIMPRVPGLDKQFEPDKEMVFYDYGDFGTLKELIDYYTAHDDEREAIRQAGHAKTRDNYTYRHRLTYLLKELAAHEPQLKERLGL